MVYIKVRNGLGNQMFVYAFGDYIESHFPEQEIKYDFSELPHNIAGRKTYEVNSIFCHSFSSASNDEIRKCCGKPFYIGRIDNEVSIKNRVVRKINNITRFPRNVEVIKEPVPWDIPRSFVEKMLNIQLEKDRSYYFDGYWEDANYIAGRRDQLRALFEFNQIELSGELLEILRNNETVSVHIRHGDYVTESKQRKLPKNFFDVCADEYYEEAFQLIKNKVENPFYIFFSDDPDYVEKKYRDVKNKYIVIGNRDYQDLYAMTLCKHSIVANSTFSFWGAFLKEQQGCVIAPKIHYIRCTEEGKYCKEFFNIHGWEYIDNSEV